MTSARFASAASIALTLILVKSARAHPEFSPTTVNRYLKIDLISPTELRLAYTVLYGAGPALAARRAADRNHDGRVDDTEARALGTALEAQVQRGLALAIDGRAIRPPFTAPTVGLMGDAVAASPLSIDLIALIPVSPRGVSGAEHLVKVDDRTVLPSLGESEVMIEESPITTLVAAWVGQLGAGERAPKQSRFLFQGARSLIENRAVTFRFRDRRSFTR